MKQALLDTSFIISAIKNKLDIFEELAQYKIIIPKQVINEIERIKDSKQKLKTRNSAKLALKIIKKNKSKNPDLGKGHTDKRILQFAKANQRTIVATLDKELKSKLKGRTLIIRNKKKLEVV